MLPASYQNSCHKKVLQWVSLDPKQHQEFTLNKLTNAIQIDSSNTWIIQWLIIAHSAGASIRTRLGKETAFLL